MEEMRVGDLKKALEGVPDNLPIAFISDTGVLNKDTEIYAETAGRIQSFNNELYKSGGGYEREDYFAIFINDESAYYNNRSIA